MAASHADRPHCAICFRRFSRFRAPSVSRAEIWFRNASRPPIRPLDGFDGILPQASDLWAHVHGEICVDDIESSEIPSCISASA